MSLADDFAAQLRLYREKLGITQEQLAQQANLDRSYVGQLERGEKSPTLTSIAKIANCLKVPASCLLQSATVPRAGSLRVRDEYWVRDVGRVTISRPDGPVHVPTPVFVEAIAATHELIDQVYAADFDLASLLGPRNFSAFFGELYAAAVIKVSAGLFKRNPHQDGYPDLLLMDDLGMREWVSLAGRYDEKKPFSPFAGGGVEVKATCGDVPSPAACRKRKLQRPGAGETRISCLVGYVWKAHHRETNNLIGLLWDYLGGRPRVAGLFYCSDLVPADWGKIVHPKSGGGRTTSVSIMGRAGVRKMYQGWLCVVKQGGYSEFLNRKNGGELIPTS